MTPVVQSTVTNDQGIILTIGVVCGGNRMQMVLPIATNDTSSGLGLQLANDAIDSAIAGLFPALVACMSSSAYISFINAEGMQDGVVPSRTDFDPTAHPGTADPVALPDSQAGLVTFYGDPSSYEPGARIHTARTFVPGIPLSGWTGTTIETGELGLLDTFGGTCQNGWASIATPSSHWQRYMNTVTPRGPSVELKKVANWTARGWVGTQRKRIIPH